MNQIVLPAILGLGAGGVYAVLALGMIVIYRGSGIINLAQGAIAAFAAYLFVALTNAGIEKYLALVVVLGACAVGGVVIAAVMRPLRAAPPLARVVATAGLYAALPAAILLIWGTNLQLVPTLLPASSVSLFGATFGVDTLYLVGVAVLLAAVLWAVFRYTTFGLVTRAAAENDKGASLLGYSPDLIASANWALGCVLAGLAGVLIAPLTGLDAGVISLLIITALPAALLGRLTSFGVAVGAGLLIGAAQTELTTHWLQAGVSTAVPFGAVIVATMVAGKSLPMRGLLIHGRPPKALSGQIPWPQVLVGVGVLAVMLLTFNGTYLGALATSLIFAIIALSVVIITGFGGQISLMQMTFTGLGAFMAAKFATNLGIPFPWTLPLAGVVAVPLGIVLGLPALRVRGMNLAIITIAAAATIDELVFQNPNLFGGQSGERISSASLAGLSLDPYLHPVRFCVFAAIVLVLMMLLVSNLRRSVMGREMLAVRSGERAAATAGISAARTKLTAFAISAFVAGLGGGALAYLDGTVAYSQFVPTTSITILIVTYIGGIATVSGALIAGLAAAGGLIYQALSSLGAVGQYYVVVSSLLVIVTVIAQPDGATVLMREQFKALSRRLGSRGRAIPEPGATTVALRNEPDLSAPRVGD